MIVICSILIIFVRRIQFVSGAPVNSFVIDAMAQKSVSKFYFNVLIKRRLKSCTA